VGTSSPGYKFEVDNTGGSTATARLIGNDQANVRLRIQNTGTSGRAYEIVGGLNGANNSHLSIYDATAAATRLTITETGLVGIGTSSPSKLLHANVGGDVGVQDVAMLSQLGNTGDRDQVGIALAFNNGVTDGAILRAIKGTSGGTNLAFLIGPDGNATAVERLRIDSSGRVGIGATTVQSLLHLSASALADLRFTDTGETTDQKNWVFQTGTGIGAGTFRLRAINDANSSGENAYVITKSGTSIQTHQWLTGGTERARITSAGLVGIGTSSPIGTLDVATAGDSSIVLANETTYTDGIKRARITKKSDNSLVIQACDSASSVDTIFRRAISTESARIDSSGRLLVGTSTSTNNIRLDEKLAVVSVGGISGASFTTYESGTADQPSIIDLQRSRGSSDGSLTVVQSGDTIGSIIFRGSDGSAFQNAARIDAYVDGTPGANDMPGRLVLSTTADGASSPTERLRITSAGLVGIGTSSPSTLLHLSGLNSGGGSANTIRVTDTDTAVITDQICGRIEFETADTGNPGVNCQIDALYSGSGGGSKLQFRTGFAGALVDALHISDTGLVGIGTTSASTILHVASTAPYIRIQDTDSSTGVTAQGGFEMYDNDGDRLFYLANESSSSSDVSLFNIAGGALKFGTSGSERGQFDSSGRLLVGTSSALTGSNSQYSKVVALGNSANNAGGYFSIAAGSARGNDEDVANLWFTDNGAGEYASIRVFADGATGSGDYPGRLVFSTTADGASSPTERMRITSDGYLRASNTGSYPSPASSNCHHLASSNNNYTVDVYNSNGSLNATVLQISADRNTSNSTYNLIRASRIGTTDVFYVRDSGNVQNVNNSYTGTSDAKLKENIINATSQWDDIKALRVCKFNFKEDTGFSTHTQIGLIAQEVEVVSPGLVDEAIDRDAEGNDLGTVTKSVNYSVLYMKAVKALQEAIGRIETLEGMVAVNNITIDEQQHQLSTLEARLTALETP
jgi:hypothetical protein